MEEINIGNNDKFMPEVFSIVDRKILNRDIINQFKDYPLVVDGVNVGKIQFITEKGEASVEIFGDPSPDTIAFVNNFAVAQIAKFYKAGIKTQRQNLSIIKNQLSKVTPGSNPFINKIKNRQQSQANKNVFGIINPFSNN